MGAPALTASYIIRLNSSHLEPGFFDLSRSHDYQPSGCFSISRIPIVATTDPIRDTLRWTCGSKRARLAEIGVLSHPHPDRFSSSFKCSRLHT